MATKKNVIPKSKAKTAYGLLSEVRALILAEPLRYNQGSYIDRRSEWPQEFGEDVTGRFPACGTVGCVAGWVATLKYSESFGYSETLLIAADILGLSGEQQARLFAGEAAGYGRAQTARHARAGAAHIRRFQKKHEKQLKAQRV